VIHVSIDDYLDGLLSGSSEPSRKAIMKLTRLLENFGGIMVKSTERMEDYINTLDARITAIERALGISTPTGGAIPSLSATPTQVATPAVSAQPGDASSGAPSAPNLSSPVSAPNLNSAPSNAVGAPNLGGSGPIPAPSGNQGATGAGISSADLLKAAASLQKAPVTEGGPGGQGAPGAGPAPSINPLGVSASDIQNIRAGLKKVDPEEHRKERAAATAGGSMPASMALNLEVKEALQKRKARTSEDEEEEEFTHSPVAPTAPVKSTKQMKEALQGELRAAFSSLLESDTQEED